MERFLSAIAVANLLCKLLLKIPLIGLHCLIYWVGEDSVIPIPVSSVKLVLLIGSTQERS